MDIGKIKKVPLREVWEREDKHFSKWLSENIEYLGEVLGLTVNVLSVEEPVGPYRVDVYGEDEFGGRVIIENQLEKTDHSHLGQILTYMVNLDAKTAIWITSNPVEEHAKVVEWLNETTPHDMYFYLVKVEAVQIESQSIVAPLFSVVEGPTQERKEIGVEKKEYAARHHERKKFWSRFLEYANSKTDLTKNLSTSTESWIGIGAGSTGLNYNFVVSKKYARVELYLNKGTQEENKKVFDYFAEDKEAIEEKFGDKLTWERMDENVTCRIKWQLDDVSVSNEDDWPKMNEFMVDGMLRMKKAFNDPIQRLK
tara:strand:+ start:2696 stop:3628 length:933 start_codon:yes stop_codon:yes gene_type:complete